ncbi:AAA family ATPase [Nakamurella deserti]|uniref:AAA family ATPase n=1 Tax=Nakamurella deserti TaxID=2164074 RepID=UPI000DBE1DF2|nr:AAA family ATPase [Nakamurella deserti]
MTEDTLITTVLDLADADTSLSEDVKLLILAALDSDETLSSVIELGPGTAAPAAPEHADPVQPVGAYLKSIKVSGFRGIGPQLSLALSPSPGLTVIAGRNGSGKSSVAEALEFAITGQSYRWANKSKVWKDSWRNLHTADKAEIRIEIAVEGQGVTTVGLDWSSTAHLDDCARWVQRQGAPRQPGLDSLGWSVPMELYRPLLSYDELGGRMEAEPSKLHDALEKILGLQQLNDALTRLTAQSKALSAPQAEAKRLVVGLKSKLEASGDSRAATALAQLRKRAPDLGAISSLVTGASGSVDQGLDVLERLSRWSVPTESDVAAAAEALESAVQGMVDVANAAGQMLRERSQILKRAVELHAKHGDQLCPVCSQGELNAEWATVARAEVDAAHAEIADIDRAQGALEEARRVAVDIVRTTRELPAVTDAELTLLGPAAAAQANWLAAPAGDVQLATHLREAFAPLAEAFDGLRVQAAELLTQREDLWSPLALELSSWLRLATAAGENGPMTDRVKAAAEWLKQNGAALRNERLQPIAGRARAIWAMLRQESNVDLGAIRLTGSGTQRKVDLRAEVDGTEAGALGVMSQGELHALALSLFLPRATAPQSPFRFVVLDDPIQAMDPSKVEGFVQVISELALDRQVIVLSHDDRLPEAVRRSGVDAGIVEVTRGADSQVTISSAADPASRYLDEAWAVARDENVPTTIKDKITPGLCRMALESAARDVFMSNAFSQGLSRVDVESRWQDAKRTAERVALALHGDRKASIDGWVDGDSKRRRALRICGRGAHQGANADHLDEIKDVKAAVHAVRWAKK